MKKRKKSLQNQKSELEAKKNKVVNHIIFDHHLNILYYIMNEKKFNII